MSAQRLLGSVCLTAAADVAWHTPHVWCAAESLTQLLRLSLMANTNAFEACVAWSWVSWVLQCACSDHMLVPYVPPPRRSCLPKQQQHVGSQPTAPVETPAVKPPSYQLMRAALELRSSRGQLRACWADGCTDHTCNELVHNRVAGCRSIWLHVH